MLAHVKPQAQHDLVPKTPDQWRAERPNTASTSLAHLMAPSVPTHVFVPIAFQARRESVPLVH